MKQILKNIKEFYKEDIFIKLSQTIMYFLITYLIIFDIISFFIKHDNYDMLFNLGQIIILVFFIFIALLLLSLNNIKKVSLKIIYITVYILLLLLPAFILLKNSELNILSSFPIILIMVLIPLIITIKEISTRDILKNYIFLYFFYFFSYCFAILPKGAIFFNVSCLIAGIVFLIKYFYKSENNHFPKFINRRMQKNKELDNLPCIAITTYYFQDLHLELFRNIFTDTSRDLYWDKHHDRHEQEIETTRFINLPSHLEKADHNLWIETLEEINLDFINKNFYNFQFKDGKFKRFYYIRELGEFIEKNYQVDIFIDSEKIIYPKDYISKLPNDYTYLYLTFALAVSKNLKDFCYNTSQLGSFEYLLPHKSMIISNKNKDRFYIANLSRNSPSRTESYEILNKLNPECDALNSYDNSYTDLFGNEINIKNLDIDIEL